MLVEQRDGAGNLRSGAGAITVPCEADRLDEMSGHRQQVVRALPRMVMQANAGVSRRNPRRIPRRNGCSFAVERSHASSVCDWRGVAESPVRGVSLG